MTASSGWTRPGWPDLSLERLVYDRAGGACCVAGVDEVGIGALAGPVVAAAVVLQRDPFEPPEPWMFGINDSKKLSPRRREELSSVILGGAVAVGVGWATAFEVDEAGIAVAHRNALVRAFKECRRELEAMSRRKTRRGYTHDEVNLAAVVDDSRLAALRDHLGGAASFFTERADSRSLSVAAASIVAKVARDRYMAAARNTYPHHGFEGHKGYGTAGHLRALKEWGVTSLHRRSFEPVKSGNFLLYVP